MDTDGSFDRGQNRKAMCVLEESRAGKILLLELLGGEVCVLFWRECRGETCGWCCELYEFGRSQFLV